MVKVRYPGLTLSLMLILVTGLTPVGVYADKRVEGERAIRLYATERVGPIGKIETMGRMSINGREARGEQEIWGGEILQAPLDRSVRVTLDTVGQVVMYRGAVARLTVNWKRGEDGSGVSMLVGTVVQGNVAVKLSENTEAYVEASGTVLTTTRGANFSVGVGESGAVWGATEGRVKAETQVSQGMYIIRPVGGRANIDVKLRKTREVQFIVTDQNDKPVPDIPVVVTISGTAATLGSGATTVTVTTTAAGIASAPVSAGAAVGTGTITASVPGGASASVGVSSVSAGVLTGTTIGIVAAAVAAGTATTVIITRQKDEIKTSSDPTVTPSFVR